MTLRDHRGNIITPPLAGATRYEYDWFTGSQIGIMFGDVLVDNIVAIDFIVNQNKTPVYGYANQYYTFAADGKVLVQGRLTVAFKEAGYLLWPIKRFVNQKAASEWTTPRYGRDSDGNLIKGYDYNNSNGTFTTAAKRAKDQRVMRGNIEQVLEYSASGLENRASGFWKELAALPDDRFEEWAEVFEDVIWYGSDPENAMMRDRLFSGNLPERFELNDEEILSHRRADQYPNLDIWIVYGDMNRPAANHTVKKLLDVSFTGQSQVIEVSGEPIYEQYSFIARNLV
jgi:hypothetical protein